MQSLRSNNNTHHETTFIGWYAKSYSLASPSWAALSHDTEAVSHDAYALSACHGTYLCIHTDGEDKGMRIIHLYHPSVCRIT